MYRVMYLLKKLWSHINNLISIPVVTLDTGTQDVLGGSLNEQIFFILIVNLGRHPFS